MELRWDRWTPLSLKHTGPTVSHMKYLGRLRRVREHIFGAFGVFSCVGSFWTVWTASAPIQYAKSENVGCWPLDALTGCVLAVWPFWLAVCWRISAVCRRGGILCAPLNSMMRALFFYALGSVISCFQCNFSAERVRREATEWLDKGSWLLVWVWAVCVQGINITEKLSWSRHSITLV